MDRLAQMHAFVTVVDSGSFGRAAEALGLSISSVSSRISQLESSLNTTLLNRNTRGFTQTDTGHVYYGLCKHILGQIDEIESGIRQAGRQPAGLLRVDVSEGLAQALIIPQLEAFNRHYPDIRWNIMQSGHLFDTTQHGFDVMVRSLLTPLDDSLLVARPLGTARTVCAASPAYLERYGTPARPEDLVDGNHRCIGFTDPITGRIYDWEFSSPAKHWKMTVPGELSFSSGTLRHQAALAGLGVINDFYFNIAPYVERGQLKVILGDWKQLTAAIALLYPKSLSVSPKVKAFADFMVARYPPDREIQPPC